MPSDNQPQFENLSSLAELFDHAENRIWARIPEYPYHRDLSEHSMVYLPGSFYVFGGHSWKSEGWRSTIARFDVYFERWSKVGDLNQGSDYSTSFYTTDSSLRC